MRSWYPPLSLVFLATLTGCGGGGEESFDLSTLGPDEIAVASVNPADGNLSPNQAVRLTFTDRAAPPEAEFDVPLDPAPAVMNPPVAGIWKWSGPAALEFVPDEPYRAATVYRATLEASTAREAGKTLRGPRSFAFTADPLRVERIRLFVPRIPGVRRTYRVQGTVSFNHEVTPGDFAGHFTLLVDGDPAEFELETEDTGLHHSFRSAPLEAGEQDRTVAARVRSGLPPAAGDGTLDTEAREEAVVPSFRRLAVEQARSASEDERRYVLLRFSEPVDVDEVESKLAVDPDPGDLSFEQRGSEVRVFGEWEMGSRYLISLPRDLQSESGLELVHDFGQSVYIDDLDPMISFAAPGNVLALRGERTVGVETINVGKIEVQLDRVYPNNLVPFLQQSSFSGPWNRVRLAEQGTRLFQREVEIPLSPNRKVLAPVDLTGPLSADSRGGIL